MLFGNFVVVKVGSPMSKRSNHLRFSLYLQDTIQRALGNTRCAFDQGKGKEGAILLEEYCVQEKIRLVDVRGFLENDRRFFEECLVNMFGR